MKQEWRKKKKIAQNDNLLWLRRGRFGLLADFPIYRLFYFVLALYFVMCFDSLIAEYGTGAALWNVILIFLFCFIEKEKR